MAADRPKITRLTSERPGRSMQPSGDGTAPAEVCGFCGRTLGEVGVLLQGSENAFICERCLQDFSQSKGTES